MERNIPMKMLQLLMILVLAACTSNSVRKSEKIDLDIQITDETVPNSKTQIQTHLSLVPNKKTKIGGHTKLQKEEEIIYYVLAKNLGQVLRFEIFKNDKEIGKMQLPRKKGEIGTIKSADLFQKIILR